MKTIPLTNSNEIALVDDADYLELSKYTWFIYKQGNYRAIKRAHKPGETADVVMHQAIMNPPPRQPVAHEDGDYRNNQRGNLCVGRKSGKHRTLNDRIEAVDMGPMREWLYYCKRNWTEHTVGQYAQIIRRFSEFLTARDGTPIIPTKLTVSDIEQYVDHVIRDRSHNTANSHLTALKSFFTWQTERYNTPNIGAKVPLLHPEPPIQRVISPDEYHTLLAIADPLEKDVIQFLAHTGLRRGEFLKLKWADIANDLSLIRFIGKGRKERIVPLSPVAKDILKKYKGLSDEIPFVARYRTPDAINRWCLRLAKRVGIPPFGPHALRHCFCTRLVNKDVSLAKVSKMLGHSSITITEKVYLHLLPQDLIGLTNVLTD